MPYFDTILTILIVAAAAFFLIKKFFGGAKCSGCSCHCQGDGGREEKGRIAPFPAKGEDAALPGNHCGQAGKTNRAELK